MPKKFLKFPNDHLYFRSSNASLESTTPEILLSQNNEKKEFTSRARPFEKAAIETQHEQSTMAAVMADQ